MKRQTLILVVIGVVLFVAGGGIAFATVESSATHQSTSQQSPTVPVVVATTFIPVGTTGEAMEAQGMVAVQSLPESKFALNDLTSLQALTDVALTKPVPKGAAVNASELRTSTSQISLPKGKDGVTISVSGVAGLAGYLQPGSEVDVYANISKLSSTASGAQLLPANVTLPCTELIMSGVEVLDVSSVVPALSQHASSATRSVPTSITILLAVNPSQARTITFMSENETLSVTQTQPGTSSVPVGQCIGTAQTSSGS